MCRISESAMAAERCARPSTRYWGSPQAEPTKIFAPLWMRASAVSRDTIFPA